MPRCRYCQHKIVHKIGGDLYKCYKCDRYLIDNFQGKLIDYSSEISYFRSICGGFSSIKLDPDAEAYAIHLSSPKKFVSFLIDASIYLIIASIECSGDHNSLVIRAKSEKTREAFNNDVKSMMRMMRIRYPKLYLPTAVLRYS